MNVITTSEEMYESIMADFDREQGQFFKPQILGIERSKAIMQRLKMYSSQDLKNIYDCMNFWAWSPLLGEKPDGWDDMRNTGRSWDDETPNKVDIIRPFMRYIDARLSEIRA